MAIIVLDGPVPLNVARLERALTQLLPGWRWRIGDEIGVATLSLDRPVTILGMAGPEILMMAIERVDRPLPLEAGAPPHHCHLKLSRPTTDNEEQAKRILLVAASSLLEGQAGSAQLTDHGRWYDPAELVAAATMLTRNPQSRVDALLADAGEQRPSATPAPPQPGYQPPPPGSPAERMMRADLDHTFSKILTEIGGAEMAKEMGYAPPPSFAEEEPRLDRLPTFVLALAHPLEFDWAPLMELDQFDRGGKWQARPGPNGTGSLTGRGGTVRIEAHPEPIPRYMLENALARSFWFEGGRPALAAQTCGLVVTSDLDTRSAPYEDVRETAKVMTLLLGLLARTPGCVALLNNGIHTLLSPAMVQSQVGHLHKNQIPLMLWTWTAPDSMVKDSVSLSSGGLLPFLGFELEVWNAPGDPEWVGDRMSQIINYLLHVGPDEIHDGDSFGEEAGDRSIRGFFGTTKAERYDKNVRVLMLEFQGPAGAAPRPDALPPSPADVPAAEPRTGQESPVDLVSLVALTKPTAFPFNIIREMLETAFPGMRWTITSKQAEKLHHIDGAGDEGKVAIAIAALGLTIPPSLDPPPHRLHVAVYVGSHRDLALARRVSLVVCSCLIISLDEQAHFRLSIDGNWLSHDDAMTGVVVPRHAKDIGDFDRVFGTPPDQFRGAGNPNDAYPPAPEESFDNFRRIAAIGGPAVGAGLRQALAGGKPPPDAPPPRGPSGFGRRLFGRKTS